MARSVNARLEVSFARSARAMSANGPPVVIRVIPDPDLDHGMARVSGGGACRYSCLLLPSRHGTVGRAGAAFATQQEGGGRPMIAGTTKLFAIVGDPVAQARSPEVFNALFRRRGVDAAMVPLHVRADDFAPVLSALRSVENFCGLVVTVPHKRAAARAAAQRSERAATAGAANVLRPCAGGWEADLLDGEGFAAGLARNGIDPRGKRCAIVGAGGAGAAIALALCERAAQSVCVSDIEPDRAASLARRLVGHGHPAVAAAPDRTADLVVNATPLGMAEADLLPFDPTSLAPGAIVADVIMQPSLTRLLREAARLGHRTVEGRHMLDGQAEPIWRFFGLPDAATGG
jgi:shikimate dehydrogenase